MTQLPPVGLPADATLAPSRCARDQVHRRVPAPDEQGWMCVRDVDMLSQAASELQARGAGPKRS